MNRTIGLLLLVAALAAAGCGAGKGAAEAAITAAQTAFDATKEKAVAIAPDQARAVQEAIDGAKASVEKGDYKAAIDAAKAVPGQVKTMVDGLAAKQQELEAGWQGLQDVPGMLTAFQSKVQELAAMKRLPAGIDAGLLDGAKATAREAVAAWGEAQAAMTAGNWAEAVSIGTRVKTALTEGMAKLGMTQTAASK
jgi:hypothetical protein